MVITVIIASVVAAQASRSERFFFSNLYSSSVTATLALMTIITQLPLMDKIHFTLYCTWA